ncbi:C13 family peptidase [Alcanivorax sp.]|uniref:C13 family peptidase n=1 Tax=Alcanivorax sp. TaxID=1872427 RepID=UPI0025C71D40|nr:C13 family peptidase [Alcanivorax sp.]
MKVCCLVMVLVSLAGCDPVQWPAEVRLPDGAVYDGETRDDLFHGEGTLTWPDGRYYEGAFREGRLHGHGKLVDRRGCVQEGQFVDGVLHGQGQFTCDEATWQGRFEQGELVEGSVSYTEGGSYQGEFHDLAPHGQGLWVTEAGQHYEGRFENGELVEGRYRDEEGYQYEGQFRYFSFHGQGTLTRPDGVVIRGEFENGYAHGNGTRTRPAEGDAQAQVEKGYFVRGRYYASEEAYQKNRHAQAAQIEARLYTESSRLQSVLSSLAPQRPGVRDVYLLVVGGDGTEGVFAREVDWVAERLGSVFDLKRRHVKLVNGGSDDLPLATRTSVREALEALDALMDPNEDLLMVHLVSHGSREGALLLDDHNLTLNDLSVADGKQWLNALKARHQWLVVSACYSGQWVDALASPRRVIFASAASDRTSFGCGDDSDRTWFSKALYGEDMAAGIDDPAAWFAATSVKVTGMEEEQGIDGEEHSMPQQAVGEAFVRWWQGNKAVNSE